MILLGNTYPLSLIRRPARIAPAPLHELRHRTQSEGYLSFWGHDNTLSAPSAILGFDPTPATSRPALALDLDLFPCLNG